VTLELGGKSPAVITENADLVQAAQRIAWGKWINAGQTCVAPDYVLVPAAMEQAFLQALVGSVRALFGVDPLTSPAYGRLVDPAALQRQKTLLESSGGEIVLGGRMDEKGLEPTILRNVAMDSPLMWEEIFGPILPVVTYTRRAEVHAILRDRDQPLASYFFTRDQAEADQWLRETRAGGTVVNHAIVHLGNPHLPFGGRGPSGMGACHGRHGFESFSHARAVLAAGWLDTVAWTFPPYGGALKRWVFRALRWLE
jgi:aldehyde dehydrogenase (NAD+)